MGILVVTNLKQISKRRIQNSSDDNDDDDSEQSVQSNDSSTMDDNNNINNNADENNVNDAITELLTTNGEPFSKRFIHYKSLPEQDYKKNQYLTSTIGELVKVSNTLYCPNSISC